METRSFDLDLLFGVVGGTLLAIALPLVALATAFLLPAIVYASPMVLLALALFVVPVYFAATAMRRKPALKPHIGVPGKSAEFSPPSSSKRAA